MLRLLLSREFPKRANISILPNLCIMTKVVYTCLISSVISQSQPPQSPVQVIKIDEPIVLDGDLTEAAWQRAQPAEDFWLYFPTDTMRAEMKTEIWMAFDDKNLYVATKCYSTGKDYVIPN